MQKNILVISTDGKLTEFLNQNITGKGYRMVHHQINEGLINISRGELPYLIILDIMTPDLEGLKYCLRIREVFKVPIMILSSLETGANEVRRLDFTSETCLTAPFGNEEFKEFIEDAIRRNSSCDCNDNENQIPGLPNMDFSVEYILEDAFYDPVKMN